MQQIERTLGMATRFLDEVRGDIGRAARAKVEQLVGSAVYLDLWVKVLPNWRKSDSALRRFGYRHPDDPGSVLA